MNKTLHSLVIGKWGFFGTVHLLSTIEYVETFHLWPVFAVSIHFNPTALWFLLRVLLSVAATVPALWEALGSADLGVVGWW